MPLKAAPRIDVAAIACADCEEVRDCMSALNANLA